MADLVWKGVEIPAYMQPAPGLVEGSKLKWQGLEPVKKLQPSTASLQVAVMPPTVPPPATERNLEAWHEQFKATLLRDMDSIADVHAVINGVVEEVERVVPCSLPGPPGSALVLALVHFFQHCRDGCTKAPNLSQPEFLANVQQVLPGAQADT